MLEICIDSVESAVKAEKAGADRLELCENLIQGGVTPSIGKINAVVSAVSIPVRVLIRPRAGNFIYSSSEINTITYDVTACANTNCEGLVIGALNSDGTLPLALLEKWKSISGTKKLVFHRAFDVCSNPENAFEQLISLGFDTVLTSGQGNTALAGSKKLAAFQSDYGHKINILAGGGVRAVNLNEINKRTGILRFHSSAKILITNKLTVSMSDSSVAEHIFTVDSNKIRSMKDQLNAL